MKNPTRFHSILTGILCAILISSPTLWGAGTIDDQPEKTTLVGTEELLLWDSGVDKKVSVTNLWKNSAITSATITGGTITGTTISGLTITTSTGTLTIPNGVTVTGPGTSGLTMATITGTETLTNKTLTSPTLTTPALGVATATSLNGATITTTTGGTLTLANSSSLITSGAYATTLTATNTTNVTLPTTGTLATRAGTETLTNKTITTGVIATGLSASGSASNDFSASTGTFKTSSGANQLTGAVTVTDATTPSVTTAAGKTNSGFFLANGKTSGGLKILPLDASVYTLTLTNDAQTVGNASLTLPDFASVSDTFVFTTLAQTLASKTLTSPVIADGLTASGSAANTFASSTGTFITSTGANSLSGAVTVTAATTPSITTAAGKTNTGFLQLNGKTSGSIKIIPSDAAAYDIVISNTDQTVGSPALTIPDFADVDDTFVFTTLAQTLASKTLTSPVIADGLTASGSAANTFASSTGTFITSTGANTLSGAVTIADATTPSLTTASGKTNTGYVQINGKTSGALKLIAADAAAYTATISLAAQTTGTTTLTIPDFANVSDEFTFKTKSQTMANKTLTSPVIATGLTASGSASNDFSASTGTFKTSSGTNIIGGNETSAFTFVQTSAAAAAFASGLAGNTNPVFRLVNNIASQATGISITGRAAAAGVDITTLSSGTNESMVIEAKGSGTIGLNLAATGAVLVGDATNPAFSVVHTTEGTGVSVTSAAAAGGVAVAAISSGTNENMTIDAKGSGTLTLNGTATGNTIIGKGVVTPAIQSITGDGAITIQSGLVVLSKGSAAAITLAAPSSQDGTRITVISTSDFAHVITVTGGLWDGTATTNTTATFPVVAGGAITMIASGTDWYVESLNGVVCAP